tara:strand:+ start:361 stop:849 length:489 start_codon:yes stop_codon:yes gene_type:complete
MNLQKRNFQSIKNEVKNLNYLKRKNNMRRNYRDGTPDKKRDIRKTESMIGKSMSSKREKAIKGKYPSKGMNKLASKNPEVAKKIMGYKDGGRMQAMGGGMMRANYKKGGSGKDTHVTKDGRTVKKGLYFYMNRAKKRGKSRPGKGTVTDKALKRSAKTAKKS